MTKPKVRVNLNGATELLNRRIPASCKHQSRSHAEGRESGKWIGMLCPLGFRDSLIVSPHRRRNHCSTCERPNCWDSVQWLV